MPFLCWEIWTPSFTSVFVTAGLDPAVGPQSYLHSLMLFVNQHLSGAWLLGHPCAWVSMVFGEQDDDMFEAARIVLSLYLHQRGCGPYIFIGFWCMGWSLMAFKGKLTINCFTPYPCVKIHV